MPAESYNNPSVFLQSAAKQLATEYRRHFKNGSFDLCKKIQDQKKKGLLPVSTPDHVDLDKTPAENFLILNMTSGRCWQLSPMSSLESKFILLSEDDLVRVFWKDKTLREQLQAYARPTVSVQVPSQDDVIGWLKNLDPGLLINKLLTDIGGFTAEERKTKKRLSRSARQMSIDKLTTHISAVCHKDFNPTIQGSYSEKGYVLRGSIKTDGFLLHLLAFKMNELNCVKYRRLEVERLPDKLTSTLGGTDHYLTEIRNVMKTKEDVQRLWECDPRKIKILGIDLGQAFTVGASALLPSSDGQEHGTTADIKIPLSTRFYNLAVSQKAVYQPTLKHRTWLEQRKGRAAEGEKSIAEIETDLPALRGSAASIAKYVKDSKVVELELETFYNSIVLKKHKWDAQRARDKEFELIAKRLLKMVGGNPGRKRDKKDKAIIGIGLGEFSPTSRLSSLHSAFSTYFMQMARSLDYIVVGVNEYYTSKRCPVCHEFVGQVDIRQLYCPKCRAKIHRDVMAGHNMCNIIQGHLLHQQRPHYLQPFDKDGKYIWEMEESSRSVESMVAQLDMKDVEQPGINWMAAEEGPTGQERVVERDGIRVRECPNAAAAIEAACNPKAADLLPTSVLDLHLRYLHLLSGLCESNLDPVVKEYRKHVKDKSAGHKSREQQYYDDLRYNVQIRRDNSYSFGNKLDAFNRGEYADKVENEDIHNSDAQPSETDSEGGQDSLTNIISQPPVVRPMPKRRAGSKTGALFLHPDTRPNSSSKYGRLPITDPSAKSSHTIINPSEASLLSKSHTIENISLLPSTSNTNGGAPSSSRSKYQTRAHADSTISPHTGANASTSSSSGSKYQTRAHAEATILPHTGANASTSSSSGSKYQTRAHAEATISPHTDANASTPSSSGSKYQTRAHANATVSPHTGANASASSSLGSKYQTRAHTDTTSKGNIKPKNKSVSTSMIKYKSRSPWSSSSSSSSENEAGCDFNLTSAEKGKQRATSPGSVIFADNGPSSGHPPNSSGSQSRSWPCSSDSESENNADTNGHAVVTRDNGV
ncbi:hypothetical protein BGZ82_001717, partial [Podila clonocystis]